MKKIMLLALSILMLGLSSCSATVAETKRAISSSSVSSFEVVEEDEIIQGSLQKNEILTVYYCRSHVEEFGVSNNIYVPQHLCKIVDYTYNRTKGEVIVDTKTIIYHWYSDATISIYTYIQQ